MNRKLPKITADRWSRVKELNSSNLCHQNFWLSDRSDDFPLLFQMISNLWTSFLYCRFSSPVKVSWACLCTSAEYPIHLIWLNISFFSVLGWPLPSQNRISTAISITRTFRTFPQSVFKITVSLPEIPLHIGLFMQLQLQH